MVFFRDVVERCVGHFEYFRCHVHGSADECLVFGLEVGLGEPEVAKFDIAVPVDVNILTLDVPVADLLAVQEVDGLEERLEPLFDGGEPLRALLLEEGLEVAAVEQLGDEDDLVGQLVEPAVDQLAQPRVLHLLPQVELIPHPVLLAFVQV